MFPHSHTAIVFSNIPILAFKENIAVMFSFKNNTAPSSGLFSSSNLFGSTAGIQQNGNPSLPFGTTSSTSSFGAASPSFSSSNLFGSTSGIQHTRNSNGDPSIPQLFTSTGVFGATSATPVLTPFGSLTSFGGTTAFNATNNATAFQTQDKSLGSSSTLPTFGKKYEGNSVAYKPLLWSRDASVSDSSIFGSYSFGQPAVSTSGKVVTTPLLKSSDFGKSTFGINKKGSRMASYTATKEKESKEKIQSICGMQTYEDKSHEELRFEDYQSGDKGQTCASIFGVSGTSKFVVIDKSRPFTPPVFNPSTVDQPFDSPCPNQFALKRPGIYSLPNENSSTTSSNPLFPKSQQSTVSRIFLPKTSFLNSDVSSPWTNSSPFAPLKAASTSSTNSIFSVSSNPWALSTSSALSTPPSTSSPCLVSPSPAHHFDHNRSFSPFNLRTLPTVSPPSLLPTPVSTPAPAQVSTLPWQLQPTIPSLSNVPSTPSSLFPTFVPLAPSQNTPEKTPNIEEKISPAISSQPLTENGQGIGHPGINVQQSYSPSITGLQPSPIMVPSETQPAVQVFVGRPDSATSVQYGISSLPVSDKTAPVRPRSSLIIRHSSLSRHRLPPQKYNPTSDKPKVPFFMDKESTSGIVSNKDVIISRENPRDWVRPTTTGFPLGSCRLSQLKHESTDGMDDGVKVNDSCDKRNIAPEEKMHYDKSGLCVQVSLESVEVDAIMPKLQRVDYYTVPAIQELISKEKEESGFCSHVKDFVVGRHGYGSIKFLGETDVRNLDLDSAVRFKRREVIIYMDESKKPLVGQGLNKPAEITLHNVKCINKSNGKEYTDGPVVNKYRDMLVKKAMEQSAEFVSYDPVEGQWKFRVSHF